VPVAIAGVTINPGDTIFGDADGVVAIPRAIEAEVFAKAAEKLTGETRTEEALARGEKLADVFERYGVL
jgi:4-hydroxy-4-methyl-2-oxoglutarate aldolase